MLLLLAACQSTIDRRNQFFLKGNQALERENFTQAIQLYDQSLKEDPDYALALNNRGVAKSELGQYHNAIIDFNQALARNPDYLEALFNRAYAYEDIGQFQNALDDVQEIKNQVEDSAFVFFYEGLILTKTKAYDRAYAAFQKADLLAPDNPEILINLATLYYYQKKMMAASEILQEVFTLAPNNANAFNLSSMIALEQGAFDLALAEINRALDEEASEPYFLNNRGYIYLEMDSLDLAIADINRSIVLNPTNGWAYRNKGIYLMKRGEYERALRLFGRAAQTGSYIDELFYYEGLAFKKQSKLSQACESWSRGVDKGETRSGQMRAQYCD